MCKEWLQVAQNQWLTVFVFWKENQKIWAYKPQTLLLKPTTGGGKKENVNLKVFAADSLMQGS